MCECTSTGKKNKMFRTGLRTRALEYHELENCIMAVWQLKHILQSKSWCGLSTVGVGTNQ